MIANSDMRAESSSLVNDPEIELLGRVVVLMSTYNGEKYVSEQLQSILRQLPGDGQILVRDDGSTDRTINVVEALGDSRVTVIHGRNLGFGASFLTLLCSVTKDAEMVMFSDQDDVWLPEKIVRAWVALRPLRDQPALYGSAQMLADANLRPLGSTPAWPRGPSLDSALTENIITGCTAALNGKAVALLQRAGIPRGVYFHDWWLYLVISAFGKVIYDDHPTLLYRQHGKNIIGHGAGWIRRQVGITRFLLRHDWVGILLGQINAFLVHYDDVLAPETRDWILRHYGQAGSTAFARWRLIFSARRWRQGWRLDASFRLILAVHKLHLWPILARRM